MNSLISKAIFALVVMTNMSSHAQSLNRYAKAQDLRSAKTAQSANMGGVATGGGDMCEDRIKDIRKELQSWIVQGGSESLKRWGGISATGYDRRMLEQIQKARIQCVGKGDTGYPVEIDGMPKVCVFKNNSARALITCDYRKFQAMKGEDQIALIHHEYAGLAGIETPNGSDSDYSYSNQLSQFVEDREDGTKKLVVKIAERNFQQVKASQFDQAKKSIPWERLAYKNYAQSDLWYATTIFMKDTHPEDIVRSAQVVKYTVEGDEKKFLFIYKKPASEGDNDNLKIVSLITVKNDSIVAIRTEISFLAFMSAEGVEGWSQIGSEAYY